VTLSPEEHAAIEAAADRLGLSPGRLLARIGRYPYEGTGLTRSAWIRDCALYAVGYGPAQDTQQRRLRAYLEIQGELSCA
jgi:hypothetical protein